jgi:hypothetical protein
MFLHLETINSSELQPISYAALAQVLFPLFSNKSRDLIGEKIANRARELLQLLVSPLVYFFPATRNTHDVLAVVSGAVV